jgi:threonine dehydrogenase-like Zn-dependent dehydrogenase
MRAFVITAPGEAGVVEVDEPVAEPGEVVVAVERVGVCGTDVEFFTGEMAYLHDGHAAFPLRIGHEWCGRVVALGEGVEAAWQGARVTGDTMLGCRDCARCRAGRQHLCERRTELGIRGGRPGALAERVAVPAVALHRLPDTVDATLGALVEPGGNALRCVRAAGLAPGERLLVVGPGAIGLLVALFARAEGVHVTLAGITDASLDFARGLGFDDVHLVADLPPGTFDAVVDASTGPEVPALALERVEPGRTVVLIGIAGVASPVDTRRITLGDVTVVGVLSASPGIAGAIARYADGSVDPRPLVGATVGLGDVAAVLAGSRPAGAGPGPKVLVDPTR